MRRYRNRHHLVPRSRNGGGGRRNLLLLDVQIHNNLHRVFGNRTLDEIIALLIRVKRAKEHQT